MAARQIESQELNIMAMKSEGMEMIQGRKGFFAALVSNRYLVLACRLLFAAIFLTSAAGKLVDIERYSVDAVYNFGILPMILARPFGLVMPFVELATGLGLLFGVFTRLAGLGGALMSLAFFTAKGYLLAQGRNIDCGCFGAIVGTLASVTIFMDIPMFFFGLIVMMAPPSARHWLSFAGFLPEAWKEKLRLVW
jgi:uncharacterized membrane protein YphA (DoxX/SURF4 family)